MNGVSAYNASGDADRPAFPPSELEPSAPAPGGEDNSKIDLIDEAFMAMGGFGRLQIISYIGNTLTQGAAAFFMYSFVFLEKEPVYQCRYKPGPNAEDNGTWS